jgi:hypothetical protein
MSHVYGCVFYILYGRKCSLVSWVCCIDALYLGFNLLNIIKYSSLAFFRKKNSRHGEPTLLTKPVIDVIGAFIHGLPRINV